MKQQTIKQIEDYLLHNDHLSDQELSVLEDDRRKGVQTLLTRWYNRQETLRKEREHFDYISRFERELYEKGYQFIAGIDEVGRGPLAGPVVASAVILKPECELVGVNDSKQLSEAKREYFFHKIMEEAVAVGIGQATPAEIDEINIYQATKLAMHRAVLELSTKPDFLLLDAMKLEMSIPQLSLLKGDAKSRSIASSSIIAKVTRDRLMKEYDGKYPGYHFSEHVGYATSAHLQAIEQLGPCPIHRRSFAPIKQAE